MNEQIEDLRRDLDVLAGSPSAIDFGQLAHRAQQHGQRRRAAATVTAGLAAVALAAAVPGLVARSASMERLAPPVASDGSGRASVVVDQPDFAPPTVPVVELETLTSAAGETGPVAAWIRGSGPGSSLCVGWAGSDRRVGPADPAQCVGPAVAQLDQDLVLQAPLPGSDDRRFTTPRCTAGPLGNITGWLTTTQVDAAVLRVAGGGSIPMTRVAGTEDWPARLFLGEVASGDLVRDIDLFDKDGRALDDQPAYTGPDSGSGTGACAQ